MAGTHRDQLASAGGIVSKILKNWGGKRKGRGFRFFRRPSTPERGNMQRVPLLLKGKRIYPIIFQAGPEPLISCEMMDVDFRIDKLFGGKLNFLFFGGVHKIKSLEGK